MSDRIVNYLPGDIKKVPRTGFRRKIIRTAQLSEDELAALIQSDNSYGEIICRCRQVSKGEVLDAIRRGASTIDGVKRRCGAGMGRCQGGYCSEKILYILADELGKDIYTITKDGTGSEFIVSSADMKA